MLQAGTLEAEQTAIAEHFRNVRNRTVYMCQPLKIEDYVPQVAMHASPPKWHLAHTTWFFEEMILKQYQEGYQVFDQAFGFLFNSYYNNVGDRVQRHNRGSITRPGVEEVYAYRKYVDEAMQQLLASDSTDEVEQLTVLGLNHEQQHQELLLTDLKLGLFENPIHPVYQNGGSLLEDCNEESGWLSMEEGVYQVGHEGNDFCFDNELNRHKVYLQSYDIARNLVTNGEFLEFIEDGGYSDFNLWLDEGWAWINDNHVQHPLYWKQINGNWMQYTLGGLQPMQQEAILGHVSYYEAAAFAAWKGMRLPTEFEWEIASSRLSWGKRWEWTNSAYLPYPGFQIAEGAVGEYNGKFMINQMVLRGASVATAEGHSRPTYRNFFHPFYRWQYSGIRLAR